MGRNKMQGQNAFSAQRRQRGPRSFQREKQSLQMGQLSFSLTQLGVCPPKQGRPARATEKEATARHLRHKGPQPHSLLEVSARLCPAHILGKEMSMGRVTGDT